MTPTLSPEEVEARLHKVAGAAGIPNYVDDILIDASDTIADLRHQLAEARAALEIIAGKRQCGDNLMSHVEIARATLAPHQDKP